MISHYSQIESLLNIKYQQYNNTAFILSDPIQIPHHFSKREDIEISGFLTATLAWGLRKTIISNAQKLLKTMDNSPFDFLMHAKEKDYKPFINFKHRTFNGDDCLFFLHSLKNIYRNHEGLNELFYRGYKNKKSIYEAIIQFRKVFFEIRHLKRSEKHVSNIEKKATAKRLNMFLRWMVRSDNHGVDFGIWNRIDSADLLIPLDIHTGNVARSLKLLERRQNDWLAVVELTEKLKQFDKNDPVKYDFALFGMGVFEKK